MFFHTARRFLALLASLSVLFGLVRTSDGASLLVNGEFASSLTGWHTEGTVFDTGEAAVLSDQGGPRAVVFQTVAVPGPVAGLVLTFDFFNALSSVAGLGQTPDTVFFTAFLGARAFGADYAGGVFDTAVPLLDADFRGAVNFAPGLTAAPSPKGAGWTRYTIPLADAAFATVGFEFIDGNGTASDSTAAVDNVSLEVLPIPEPHALALTAGALLLLRKRGRVRRGRGPPRRVVGCLLAMAWMTGAGAQEGAAVLEQGLVAAGTAERSTLDRGTGVLTSTVEVTAKNEAGARIDGPVHVLIRFKTPAGVPVTSVVTVDGAQGGFGSGPWGTPFFDVTAQLGADGWQPGETLAARIVFSRQRTLNVLYEVTFAGRLNHAPVVDAGGPYAGRVGGEIDFAGTASDPDGDPLTFRWDFGDGTSAAVAETSHTYATVGVQRASLTVDDGRGGVVVRDVTVLVTPEGDFALAHTRVVDGTGHPLAGVTVTESGPAGERTLEVDESGFVSLGVTPGGYTWKFACAGHLPVWRRATLGAGEIVRVPSPWLARENLPAAVSALEPVALKTEAGPGAAAVDFPAGAFAQGGEARLTALGPQTLPFPLAVGWSPLGAFRAEFGQAPTAPGAVRLTLTDELAAGEFITFARFDEAALAWRIEAVEPGTESVFPLTDGGTYAALVADTGTGAPVPATVGEFLPAGAAQDQTQTVAAAAQVRPAERTASLDPALVTAEGEAVFTPQSGVLPSGSWFRLSVQEGYDLTDGTGLRTPDYDVTVFAYRRPAGQGQPTAAAPLVARSLKGDERRPVARLTGEGKPAAIFPLRPRVLFSPADLREARLHADVWPPLDSGTAALTPDGGLLEDGGVRVTVPAGALGGTAAGALRAQDAADFASLLAGGLVAVKAFELNVAGLAPGAALTLALTEPVEAGKDFVLAKLVTFPGGSGLQPMQRLRSDATGALVDGEPATGTRLPGLNGGGGWVLVELSARHGVVTGGVRTAGGALAQGMGLRLTGQPWLSVSGADGRYFLTAPEGAGSVLATHPSDGSGAVAAFSMGSDLAAQTVDLTLGAVAPRIVSTTPEADATKVPVVTPVRVEFSEKLAPASLGAQPATLRADGAGADTPLSATLDLASRVLTLLPTDPLLPGTVYTVTVAETITDRQSLPLAGERTFSFTTAPVPARGEGAQLTIWEPGATTVPADVLTRLVGYRPGAGSAHVVAHGGPGTAEGEVPVVLVNESTGLTATVLSAPDGSFASFVEADEADFVSAVFVNGNGTRITVAATRQLFDDGRVGLYRPGGILEAENNDPDVPDTEGTTAVEVTIPPAAIGERGVYQLRPVPVEKVVAALGDALPTEGTILGGVVASHDAAGTVALRSEIEFEIDPGNLVLPPGITRAEDATFLLTRLQMNDGVPVLEMLDTMAFADGRLTTRRSPPDALAAPAVLPLRTDGRQPRLAGAVDRLKNLAEDYFNGLTFAESAKKQFLSDVQDVLSGLTTGSFTALARPNQILDALGLPSFQATISHQLLLPVMLAQGTTTNVGGRVIAVRTDDQGQPQGNEQSVAGALVTLEQPPLQSAGRLRPGQITASTDAGGKFMLRVDVGPEGAAHVLAALHPRFPGQRPVNNGTVGNLMQRLVGNVPEGGTQGVNVQLARLSFVIPPAAGTAGDDLTAPSLSLSHVPLPPAVGLGAADPGATVTVAAADTRDVASLLVSLQSATAFGPVPLDPATDVELGPPVTLATTGPRLEQQITVKCARPGRVVLDVVAADSAGNQSAGTYAIDFGRPSLVPDLGGADVGPRVLSMTPAADSAGHAAFPDITLRFTRALPEAAFQPGNTDWLVLDADHYVTSFRPSADRREVVVGFAGLETGPVTVTVGSPLTDESGRPFDQDPEANGAQAFTAGFTLAAPAAVPLDLTNGTGVGLLGGWLFALDRLQQQNSGELVAYDVTNPLQPVAASRTGLAGEPVDLAVIPSWSFIPRPGDGPLTRPIVAVMTSQFGSPSDGNAGQGFKNLRLYDVSDPAAPQAVARGNVSFDPVSKIVKIAAVAPFLVYQELSSDVTSLHIVDLAAFTLGHNATPAERVALFPLEAKLGTDLNGDGDFVDAGELNSLPARRPATYFGDFFSWAPETRDERLVDFSLGGRGLLTVITTRTDGGPAALRQVLTGSDAGDPVVGTLFFGAGEDPKRIAVVTDLPVQVGGVRRLMDVALVSMRTGAGGRPSLAVIDLSDPKVPVRLGDMPLDADDGIPNTLVRRGGTALVLATANNTLELDSERLLQTDAAGRSLAVRGRLSGFGGGVRTFVADASGLAAVASSGRNQVAFTGPSFEVVTLPDPPDTAEHISQRLEVDIAATLRKAESVAQARKAAVTFDTQPDGTVTVTSLPNPADHYYVVCRVPGGAAGPAGSPATLDLTLSSVSLAGGYPVLQPATVFPRLLVDDATRSQVLGANTPAPGAYPTHFKAHRLSSESTSPLFNTFLAGPFTLHQALSAAQAQALTAQAPRTFLRLDKCLWVGLAPLPATGGNFLAPFQPVLPAGEALRPGDGLLVPCDYQRNPLVFVPGVMASKLRSGSAFDAWLSVPNLGVQLLFDAVTALAKAGVLRVEIFGLSIPLPSQVPAAAGQYFNALNDLVLDPSGGGKQIAASDVLRELFVIGQTAPIESVQEPLLKHLREELGYREYEYDRDGDGTAFALETEGGHPNRDSLATLPDLFPFPYDWRLDNAQNAGRLAKYIDLIREANPDVTNVDVVAHSMGGLLARRYMLEHPGVVQTFVSACSPYLGSPKAAMTLKTGDLDEFGLNVVVGLELGKQIARHMPALHQLMPTQGYFDLGGRPVVERGWDGDGNGSAFDTLDYAGYRAAMDGSYVHEAKLTPPNPISAANEPFHTFAAGQNNTQDDWRGDTSGARIYHIVSATQKPETISRVRLTPRLVPAEPVPNLTLDLPPVDFEDSEQVESSDPVLPVEDFPDDEATYRLEYTVGVDRGMGDGTVPLLSQVRGFGSPKDLNAPGAVVLPLVSRDPRKEEDTRFSHAGMLKNPEFFELLGDILLGEEVETRQPKLTLQASSAATEGAAAGFSVAVTGGPVGETPTVVWDTGDGGFAIGQSGTHAWQQDGTYTLTCLVGFAGGPGAVASAQVSVGNVAPTVTLTAEGTPRPGEELRFIAAGNDAGADDALAYAWDFGDGTTLAAGRFAEGHAFASTGTFTVRVTATDEDGAQAVATTSVTISATAVGPLVAPRLAPRDSGFGSDDDPPPVEFVQIAVGGHDSLGEGSPRVLHDTQGAAGQALSLAIDEVRSVFENLRSVQVAQIHPRAVEMRVYRMDPAGSSAVPGTSTVTLRAVAQRMDIRVQHHRASGVVQCFEWQVETQPDSDVELTIPWEALGQATEDALVAFTDPEAFVARRISCIDTTPPAILEDFDDLDDPGSYAVRGLDLLTFEGTALPLVARGARQTSTTLDRRAVFTLEPPPTAERQGPGDPGGSEFPTLEGLPVPAGSIAREISAAIPRGSEPSTAKVLVATDSGGNASRSAEKISVKPPVLTPAVAQRITDAVKDAFTTGAQQEFYKKFVIRHADVRIFEQGTGAALWKNLDKAALAYTPGQSDNDYELFLPAIVSPGDVLDPNVPADVQAFENEALTDTYMQGDWYFKPPTGLFLSFELPPPDENDPAAVAAYTAQVTTWRYTVPALLRTLGAGTGLSPTEDQVIEIPKGFKIFSNPPEDKSVFDNAATPAAIISFVLTENLKRNPDLRKTLPDVSFFPFRREHFEFGLMSLERPPPFGDDPIGDAGMGRSLLLLKWVLEGAFLPPFGDFNAGVNDAALRQQVFARLASRPGRLEPEGLEWGLYQEFAALSESAHLLVVPCEENGTPLAADERGVFGDYFSAHDKKTAKKVGKAAIRGVLARLATEDAVRPSLFAMTPAQFDADLSLPSFEHLVARLGKQHASVFGGGQGTADLIDSFLDAKIGQPTPRLKAILATPGAFATFVRQGFDFLRTQVQVPTEDDYTTYLETLLSAPVTPSKLAEHDFRTRNATAVDQGLVTTGGGFKPGRLAFHGLGTTPADLSYKFQLKVSNRTEDNPVSATVTLDSGGQSPPQSVTFPVPAGKEVKFPDAGNPAVANLPALAFSRSAAEYDSVIGTMTLSSSFNPAEESTLEDNTVFFEHHRVPLGVFLTDGAGSLQLALVREENPAEPLGDCVLTVSLVGLEASGGNGSPLPGAALSYFDVNGVEHPIVGGRVLLNRGATREPIAWPILIVGEVAGTQLDAVDLDARFDAVFRDGLPATGLTTGQTTFSGLLKALLLANNGNLPVNLDGPDTAATALAPSLIPGLQTILSAPDGAALEAAVNALGNVHFAVNTDVFPDPADKGNLRTVFDQVTTNPATGPGLTLANLTPGQPQAALISIPTASPPWNPGRNGKVGADTRSNGQVFVHRDLLLRALAGESLDFRFIDLTTGSLPVTDVLKVEFYHELVFRLLSLATEGLPNFNGEVDRALLPAFPAFEPTYTRIFGAN